MYNVLLDHFHQSRPASSRSGLGTQGNSSRESLILPGSDPGLPANHLLFLVRGPSIPARAFFPAAGAIRGKLHRRLAFSSF